MAQTGTDGKAYWSSYFCGSQPVFRGVDVACAFHPYRTAMLMLPLNADIYLIFILLCYNDSVVPDALQPLDTARRELLSLLPVTHWGRR